jgi:hypothetical protein
MKIITLHKRINPTELRDHIRENLDSKFKDYRDTEVHFVVEGEGNVTDISQPELYPGDILYHIEAEGQELHITRSEHYTDDVNSLTIESILNDLFKDHSGINGTDLLQEG